MANEVCEVAGCSRERQAGRLCWTHDRRRRVHGTVLADVPVRTYVRRLPVAPDMTEAARVALAPAPAEGHGFLWLI